MKKFLIFLVVLIVAVFALVFFFKDQIVKAGIEIAASKLTGFETKVGNLHFDIPQAIVHVEDLKIYNPSQFQQRIFADIPEIYISLNLQEILKKERIHFYEIRLAIRQVNIEKNSQGVSNVALLSSVGKSKEGRAPSTAAVPPAPSEKKPALPFYLDRLQLTMRKVSYQNFSAIVPQSTSVDLNVEKQVFTNIQDPKVIVSLILMKIIYGTTFGNLGLDPAQLQHDLKKTMGEGVDLLKGTAGELTGTAEDVVRGTLGGTKGILKQATGTVKTAKGEIGSIFGKLKSRLPTSTSTSSQGTTDNTQSTR